MGEPKIDIAVEFDEQSISSEWEAIADGELSSTPLADEERDLVEESGELFADLVRRNKPAPASVPPRAGTNMAAALTIVQGGKASKTPLPPPPSRRDPASLAVLPPSVRLAPLTLSGRPPSAPPPPSVRAASALLAPPPPSARNQVPRPNADAAPPATERAAVIASPILHLVESAATAPSESSARPVVIVAPPVPRIEPREPVTIGSVVIRDLEVRPVEVKPSAESAETWNEETPTALWKGGHHGIPDHIAARMKARMAADESAKQQEEEGEATALAGKPLPVIPPPPGLPRFPGVEATEKRARATTPVSFGMVAPPSIPPMTITGPPPSFAPRRGGGLLIALAAALALGVAALALVLVPRAKGFAGSGQGALVVTVAAVDGTAVGPFELFVDGQRKCSLSPCRVDAISQGSHFVKVTANGFSATADRAFAVTNSEDSVLHLALTRLTTDSSKRDPSASNTEESGAGGATSPDTLETSEPAQAGRLAGFQSAKPAVVAAPRKLAQGTLNISSSPPSNVIVDGRPLGLTPQSVRLAAGNHTVVFASSKGRQVRSVTVKPGASASVGAKFR